MLLSDQLPPFRLQTYRMCGWIQAVTAIVGIIAGGRVLLRPIYRRIADLGNNDVFAALTLLVVLGTSMMTQLAGLSLALGAFLVSHLVSANDVP